MDGEKIEFMTDNNQNLKQEVHIDLEELDIMASISDTNPTQNSKLVLNTIVTSSSKPIEGVKVYVIVTKEGDVLILKEGKYYSDKEATKQRKEYIKNKFKNMWED